jgi:hypothetical protein
MALTTGDAMGSGEEGLSGAFSATVRAIRREMARFDLHPAQSEAVAQAQAFAVRLIGAGVADATRIEAVHERSGAGLFVAVDQGRVTGALALALLSPAGLAAIEADRFDAVRLDLLHIAPRDAEPAAVYAWGVAAADAHVGRRLVAAARAVSLRACPHLPCFGRAATAAGRHLLVERLGASPLPVSRTGLLRLSPPVGRRAAA